MERRDFLKLGTLAGVSLPEVAAARIQPEDVIVVSFDYPLSQASLAEVSAKVIVAFPKNKHIILTDGAKLSVVSKL